MTDHNKTLQNTKKCPIELVYDYSTNKNEYICLCSLNIDQSGCGVCTHPISFRLQLALRPSDYDKTKAISYQFAYLMLRLGADINKYKPFLHSSLDTIINNGPTEFLEHPQIKKELS